ncbi:MAG TPA: hypothetical protein VLS44_08775 [Nitrospira sp.]|nr:hypothetical protein [Nitrospira sp.]
MNHERELTGPGIIVLSSSLEVLHMNRRALALLTQLEDSTKRIGAAQALTAPLHPHGRDILETMQERLASDKWAQFQHDHTIADATHPILVKGFGLPDRRGLSHSRIMMLLSAHNPVPLSPLATAAEHN